MSLYLLGLDFRALAVPDGPRPCFRSCMVVTSWLAVRGREQCFGIQGGFSQCPTPPQGVLASSARGSLGKPRPL